MNGTGIYCSQCGKDVIPLIEPSGPHMKASCSECGRYLKFLNKQEKGDDMAELEMFFEYPDNKFGEGIMLEEYNDRISLVLAQRGKGEGTIWKKWVFPQNKDRQPIEKAIPHKIYLGHNRETAIEMLRKIAIELKGKKENDKSL